MNDSEAYVRDHLLIEFMLDCYVDTPIKIEDVYKEWMEWLKRQVTKHEQRS